MPFTELVNRIKAAIKSLAKLITGKKITDRNKMAELFKNCEDFFIKYNAVNCIIAIFVQLFE